MKKCIILCVTLLIANAGFSQSKEYARVEAALEKLRLAMISGVREDLEYITDESLSYGHSSGAVENKSEFVEKIASGKSDFLTINNTDQKISITGNVAVIRHQLFATNNDNGKPGEVKLKILLVFKKVGKDWKLLARQAVKST